MKMVNACLSRSLSSNTIFRMLALATLHHHSNNHERHVFLISKAFCTFAVSLRFSSQSQLSTMLALFVNVSLALQCLSLALAGPVDMRSAPRFNRTACQLPTTRPLQGCPAGTLLVGPSGNYKTIQSAVAALPNSTLPAVILIQAGNYTEQVNVTRAAPVYLLGQTSNTKSQYENRVNVIWRAVAGTGDNAFTATLTIAPNLNADLTGAGPTGFAVPPDTPFGNTDFRAYNLNFINDFVPYSDGPSLTLSMGYANAGFYQCQFLSYQDTVRRKMSFI